VSTATLETIASPATLERDLVEARYLHRDGRLEEAEVMYRSIPDVAPGHIDAAVNRGAVLCENGKLDEAKTVLRRILTR